MKECDKLCQIGLSVAQNSLRHFIFDSFPCLPPGLYNATMKISSIAASMLAAASMGTIAGVQAFVSSPASSRCVGRQSNTLLSMSSNGPDDDMLKASAEQMKNLKPEDIDRMMAEMESMGPAQKVCE